ncbi:MAG TPA: DUF1614 domain-containing protein [Burkholderiales bacterium]|nr:DUF1614 domain-containing protein [Burkholderiales bacterium]
MRAVQWLSFWIFLLLLALLPFFFAELMAASLAKLHLSPAAAVALVIGMMLGGMINIPVARIRREDQSVIHPLAVFGLENFFPQLGRVSREMVIAVNVGGCLIPTGLAGYELIRLLDLDSSVLVALAAACAINIAVCYRVARPVRGLGIAMPGLVPALLAAMSAWLLAPEQAAPVAFIAGVAGPLVGADLLHLKDIRQLGTGVASIGGAGTFDGIVLSGIVAAYLA